MIGLGSVALKMRRAAGKQQVGVKLDLIRDLNHQIIPRVQQHQAIERIWAAERCQNSLGVGLLGLSALLHEEPASSVIFRMQIHEAYESQGHAYAVKRQ